MVDRAEEYLDALVSMELAAILAEMDHRPIGESIRTCCQYLLARINDRQVRTVIAGVQASSFPPGALYRLRRHLDTMITTGKFD